MAEALDDTNWLSPFGAESRYPGDRAEVLPGEEVRARELAQRVRDAVMSVLDPYLCRRLSATRMLASGPGRTE